MARPRALVVVAIAALALAGYAYASTINTDITTPTTWDATVNPVHVTATIHVQAPLTIADGETVQLDPGVSIIVDSGASLTAPGGAMGVVIDGVQRQPRRRWAGHQGARADRRCP